MKFLLQKFNTELFGTYNHERTYYHCPHNHISAYTKYVAGLTVFSGHMLPENLSTAAPKISGCFLQNTNLVLLMFDLC